MSEIWKDDILFSFSERDATDKSLWLMIEQYRKLSQETLTIRDRNKNLLRAANVAKFGANGNDENPVEAALIKSLENNIAQLRDELSTAYKQGSQNAQRLLVLTETLREGEERSRYEAEQMRSLKSEVERLGRKVEESKEMKKDKEKIIEHLNDELRMLQLEFTQLEAKNIDLENDNKALLQRWLDHMNLAASKMNEANAKARVVDSGTGTRSDAS